MGMGMGLNLISPQVGKAYFSKILLCCGGLKVSSQFQFTHGNFSFTHGDFNILTAISQFYSRQFQFFLWERLRHFSLLSPPVSYGGRQWPCTKSQNAKSKVDIRTSRTRGYLHETATNSDWYDFVSVSMHLFSCVYRPKNELRPV